MASGKSLQVEVVSHEGRLWHGAAVRFFLWGGLHGAALALHKLWMSVVPGA